MPDIEFQFNEDDFKRIQNRIRNLSMKRQAEVWETGFKNAAEKTKQQLVSNVSGPILRRRTGKLAQSIQWRVQKTDVGLVAFVGANVLTGRRVPYADILETGGTITAKKGKFLAVPLRAALTGAGTTKAPSPRDFPNTFFRRTKQGRPIIFQKNGNRIVPLFILFKRVNIKPYKYMSTTLAQVKPMIKKIMEEAAYKELNK